MLDREFKTGLIDGRTWANIMFLIAMKKVDESDIPYAEKKDFFTNKDNDIPGIIESGARFGKDIFFWSRGYDELKEEFDKSHRNLCLYYSFYTDKE